MSGQPQFLTNFWALNLFRLFWGFFQASGVFTSFSLKRFGLTNDQAAFGLTEFSIMGTLIADKCPAGGPCDSHAPYRFAQCCHFTKMSQNMHAPIILPNKYFEEAIRVSITLTSCFCFMLSWTYSIIWYITWLDIWKLEFNFTLLISKSQK